ncbi:hypothetical protein D9619_011245 [Psilocybe cf. subviscida]|uniref:Uncharacterized protein n=1 Tax=Psilocybe cf. subviscida TaxID=2480587 RepID=A0A8H5F554_9AGAR|nr:hypothetical protein D9619_011245 [Psilocybe cf. subviscida]
MPAVCDTPSRSSAALLIFSYRPTLHAAARLAAPTATNRAKAAPSAPAAPSSTTAPPVPDSYEPRL